MLALSGMTLEGNTLPLVDAATGEPTFPKKLTCDGKHHNDTPTIYVSGVNAMQEKTYLAIFIVDHDAPSGNFIHYGVMNIPIDPKNPGKISPINIKTDTGAPGSDMMFVYTEGNKEFPIIVFRNGFGKFGFTGPCPPGKEKHAYTFYIAHYYDVITKSMLASYKFNEKPISETSIRSMLQGSLIAIGTSELFYARQR